MAISEESLRERYQILSDEKLLRLAGEDAARLRPEALQLLRQELAARGLAELAEERIAVQLRVLSETEVAAYCELVRAQPCPRCWSSAQPLNATVVSHVASFIVATTWKEQLVVACPTCLDALNRKAATSSALLGWWGLPWGIIYTTRALIANHRMAQTNRLPQPNNSLRTFVVDNVAAIDAASSTAHGLQALLTSLLIKVNRTNKPAASA